MAFNVQRLVKIRKFKCYSTLAQHSVQERVFHVPVMAQEVCDYLEPEANQTIIDMTFGAGGHSRKILESAPNINLVALDRDPVAHNLAIKLSHEYPNRLTPLLGRFSELPNLLNTRSIRQNSVDGILFDFGCSSMQFDVAERGFSVSKKGPLDMRMDGNRFPKSSTAADVLERATEEDLYRILKIYGEEKQARKIAQAIVDARYLLKPLQTTEDLADLVDSVCSGDHRLDKLQRRAHNATKTFQALRIFVNNELNEINYGMILAQHYLKVGGRLVTVTFHSLEDTIVKRHVTGNLIKNMPHLLPLKYRNQSMKICQSDIEEVMQSNWESLHRHVIVPSSEEIENNPRSRSAKLRAAMRIS